MQLYQDIDTLSLDRFIACLCKGELEKLLIEGEATNEVLQEQWDKIYAQYLDAAGEAETLYIFSTRVKLYKLQQKITELESAAFILSTTYDQRVVAIVKAHGLLVSFNPDNKEQYQADFKKIEGRLIKLRVDLRILSDEVSALDKGKEGGVIDCKYFTQVLLRLAKYQGCGVLRAKDLMVSEYVLLLKDYNAHIQAQIGANERGQEGL